MNIREELKSGGVYPTGPCSAWPKERNEALVAPIPGPGAKMPGMGKMAKGLARTAAQAVRHGKVSQQVREERYDICKGCPFFDHNSKRCKDCGCFMEAKTWVGGNPDYLCPQKKWRR